MQVIATWSGGRADLLRQAFRMTNESYAEYLTVSVRTVANWRGNPDVIPRPAIQDILDAALERAPDRVKAQFARVHLFKGRIISGPFGHAARPRSGMLAGSWRARWTSVRE